MKTFVVYRHIFPNGKNYIGITCAEPYTRRWRGGSSYQQQPKMWKAICKYGWENIKHEILYENLSQDEANQKEQEMIEYYNSVSDGYNISTGGGGTFGIPCSEETKRKIGAKNKGKPGRHPEHLAEYIRTHGAWNKGKSLSPSHYEKIAQERKQRCSKKIGAFDPKTRELVMIYESATCAAKANGVSKEVISRCANGRRKTSAGFVWGYLHDNI